MNAQPNRGAFAAFPKENDKCAGGMGTLGIDWAIRPTIQNPTLKKGPEIGTCLAENLCEHKKSCTFEFK